MERASHVIELRSDPAELRVMRTFVAEWVERSRLPEEISFRAALAATEAVSNAIRHGRRESDEVTRPIKVMCRLDQGDLVIEVHDRGRFRSGRANPDDDGGRGLLLMRELTRSFDVHAAPDGTRIALRLGTHHVDGEPPGDPLSGGVGIADTRAA